MKTNIFLNSYQQPENKLTYNFLAVLDYLNSQRFCEILFRRKLADKPLQDIRLVHGGGESNPDGSFLVKDRNGDFFTVYFENKTFRRGLCLQQLRSHLDWLKNKKDLLLVITPRHSDREMIKQLGDERIIFFTWAEIVDELKAEEDVIIKHFIEYGKLSGEFEELGSLDKSDLKLISEFTKINFTRKIDNILKEFHSRINIADFGFSLGKRESRQWERYGTEFINIEKGYDLADNTGLSFGQWFTIAYYFDTRDHGITFKKNEPEICAFFDVHPAKKNALRSDQLFIELINKLTELGFESNLNEELSKNPWRLFFYRRPISDLHELSANTLLDFANEVFSKLLSVNIHSHNYFTEMMKASNNVNLVEAPNMNEALEVSATIE